jgi:hypothetical protein
MTIAELKKKSEQELDELFLSMPEPSYPKAINTEVDRLDQIIHDFSQSKISEKDRKALQNDLINFA